MKNKDLLGESPISKLLFKLSIPAIIAMLINAIYNIVDTYFVSLIGENASLGAVSIAFPLFMMIAAIGQMIGVGSGAYISRLLGSKKIKEAEEVLSVSVISTTIVGVIITFLSVYFLDDILLLMGVKGELFHRSHEYMYYIFIGATFTIINMVLNNLIRAEGNSMYSMMAICLGAFSNIALDPLFIFKFDMGVKGASIATTIAQIISTVFLFKYFYSKHNRLNLSIKNFKPTMNIYKNILVSGLPSFVRQALASIAVGLVNIVTIPFGDAAVASISIILRISSIGSYVLFGLAQGLQPIVAFNFGANNTQRVKEALKKSLIAAMCFGLIYSISVVLFAGNLVNIFTSHPKVLKLGTKSLSIVVLFFIGNAFQIVITTFFQSLGRGVEAFFLAVSRQGIFFIPLILSIPRLLGFYGVSYSLLIADILAFIITFIFYMRLRREFSYKLKAA